MFLKEKRDQTVKDCVVAGGNKERSKIDKLDATSSTAALEYVLRTAVIDAHEQHDMAVIDIPNAFVQTRLEDDKDKASMQLRCKLAELMVKVAPKIYTKYVIINKKGETVLYVCPLNSLYCISALLSMPCQRLEICRFRNQPLRSLCCQQDRTRKTTHRCVVQERQLTVVWHVDDLKVSYVSAAIVTKMADWLKSTYERLFEDGSSEMQIT